MCEWRQNLSLCCARGAWEHEKHEDGPNTKSSGSNSGQRVAHTCSIMWEEAQQ